MVGLQVRLYFEWGYGEVNPKNYAELFCGRPLASNTYPNHIWKKKKGLHWQKSNGSVGDITITLVPWFEYVKVRAWSPGARPGV